MVTIDKNLIKYLTQLSRIACSEQEQEALMADLDKIVRYMNQLDEVDTSKVAPCNQVLDELVNVMREDVVEDVLPREVFLSNAPSQVGGMIRVPPVLRDKKNA